MADSFNPLADVMRASVASLARNISRTDEEIKAETAAVKMIQGQAAQKLIDQRARLRNEHLAERADYVSIGFVAGSDEMKELIAQQKVATDALDRLLAKLDS